MVFAQSFGFGSVQPLIFGTALNGTVFCQLTILRPQITKMAACKLSKNDWFMPFFAIFRFTREKLLVTVSFDHPVFASFFIKIYFYCESWDSSDLSVVNIWKLRYFG